MYLNYLKSYARPLIAVGLASHFTARMCCTEGEAMVALSKKEFRAFPITKITDISSDTKAFEVKLPSEKHEVGLTVSSLVMVKNSGEDVRPYTPTTLNDVKGKFELVVKAYPEGKVSGYMHQLKVGDKIEVKGPFPKLAYKANMKKRIGMIAGGTGITPMLQVIKEILRNPDDHTEVHLLFANRSEADILLKDTLDELQKKHANFRVTYIVEKASSNWTGYVGRPTPNYIRSFIPAAAEDTLVYVCGPPGMMEAVSGNKTKDYKQGPVAGSLKDLGYTEDMVYKF